MRTAAAVLAAGALLEALLVHLGRTYGSTASLFRSRWSTAPWWLTLGGWLAIVPADVVMSRDMRRGVGARAEALHRTTG